MHPIGSDGQRRQPVAAALMGVVVCLTLQRAWAEAAACAPAAASSCPAALAKPGKPAGPAGRSAAKPVVKAKVAASPAVVEGPPPGSFRATLDPLQGGGWVFISDGPPENPSAVYASTHGIQHIGNVITAWIRWEFARPQAEVYPLHYLSAVTREELDCDARAYRRAGVYYYARNDLQEKEVSFTALDDDTTWKSAIPGTEGDAMLIWGCPAATAATAAQKADAKPGRKSKVDAAASSAPAPGLDLHTVR